MDVITMVLAALGLSGCGILFYREEKRTRKATARQNEAAAKEANASAEAQEDEAFRSRIRSMSNEMQEMQEEMNKLKQQIKDLTQELEDSNKEKQAYKMLCAEKDNTIANLEEQIRLEKEKNTKVQRENSSLRGQITKLNKKIQNNGL